MKVNRKATPKVKSPAVTRALPPSVKVLERPIVATPSRKGPPAPPARKGPPAPPPMVQGRLQGEFPSVIAAERAALPGIRHRQPVPGCTHLIITLKNGETIVTDIHCLERGDFDKIPGEIRFGKLIGPDNFRYAPGEDPGDRTEVIIDDAGKVVSSESIGRKKGPPKAVATTSDGEAPAPKSGRKPSAGGKREGVCGFIDQTIMDAAGKLTAEQVLDIVMKQFPDRDRSATLNTVRARPSHMRKAGKEPQPFKK